MRSGFAALTAALLLGAACAHVTETARIAPQGERAAALRLSGGVGVVPRKDEHGRWTIAVQGAGLASGAFGAPVAFEFDGERAAVARGYDTMVPVAGGLRGGAAVDAPGGARLALTDEWRVDGDALRLHRRVTVERDGQGGFGSAATFAPAAAVSRDEVDLFAPGMIYGGTAGLTDVAIGGARVYASGEGASWIRIDRLPAPMFGARFADGRSITVLNPEPRGATTAADANDTEARPLTDAGFGFGSLGAELPGERLRMGFRFPGTEGEVTYKGNTYPGGQVRGWRRRYHPLRRGVAHEYRVAFRFGRAENLPAYYRDAWRWAWSELRPELNPHDIAVARRALVDVLASRVETVDGRSGLAQFTPAPAGAPDPKVPEYRDRRANMGFVGKNLEAAEFMLAEANRDPGPRGVRLRALGERVIDSFTRLPMSPPAGEGFNLETGEPSIFTDPGRGPLVVYLRSLSDDMKALLRAVRRERAAGRERAAWLAWARGFGDWLLTQQRPDGGFPRAWEPGTGRVAVASPASSYNPVPFLVLLSEATRDRRYLDAAVRAGEFTWGSGQARGVFVGGTIDNPDVIDKEAGTLSLEAYLALFEATRDRRWLERARRAADFAETWIYLWDVPMPPGVPAPALHWKPGVPTTGAQLISTGHSLTDQYMSFDVDEFAKLYRYTGDPHYREVARLLLHNTKSMLALPGRIWDLKGPGWQQEHWSFAPRRGRGLHRGWLPWVATSQLNGIVGLEEFDPALFRELAGAPRQAASAAACAAAPCLAVSR